MKPPPFAYHAPTTEDAALEVLDALGGDAKVLAGGQSLIPLLNMRLVAPAHLVDITRIPSLDRVEVDRGGVTVGAGARHVTVERDERSYRATPLLRQALRHVAHPVIRNRGTACGSIAHADPAGELTAVLALLDGRVHVARRGSPVRAVPADEFFVAPLESSLRPGELVTSVWFPRQPDGGGSAFVEMARRHGDYAVCGVAATVVVDDDGGIAQARVGAISVHPTPLVVDVTGPLGGAALDDDALAAAAALVDDASRPERDLHATVAYRRHLTRVLTVRALRQAEAHARARAAPGREDEHG